MKTGQSFSHRSNCSWSKSFISVEALEARLLLTADPGSAVMLNWHGQNVPVQPGSWILGLSDDSGLALGDASGSGKLLVAGAGGDDGLVINKSLGADGMFEVSSAPAATYDQVLAMAQRVPGFQYLEPNFILHADATIPNDPQFSSLYGLNNTGQTGGIVDADIDAPEAWDLSTGSNTVVVGVIDTGVDYTHPDLAANIWTNPGEIAGNGIDDDGNGFVDDVHGYDFVGTGDSNPMDDHYHGTHVSGTIGAVGNNGVGVAGVNWHVSIMPLKFLDSSGNGNTTDAIEAVNYATMMRNRGVNIRVLSNSWGGGAYSSALETAISQAAAAGILFVAAAGNDSMNTDTSVNYPSCYNVDNIISVAATDASDALASFSNWGLTTVDLSAPGVNILSTEPGNTYGTLSGTSMATPHVAGVAALAFAINPSATYQQVRDAIFAGADKVSSMSGKSVTGGRLNAYKTLQLMGLSVANVTPAIGAVVGTKPVDFTVDFSAPVEAASVAAGDFTVNSIPADNFTAIDADTVLFHFNTSPVTAQGPQTMAINAGSIRRLSDGNPNTAWTGSFRYDALTLAVVSSDPADGAMVSLPLAKVRLTFNEAFDPATMSAADLVLSRGSVTAATKVDATTIDYTVSGILTEGPVTMTMAAGAMTDTFGNPMSAFSASFQGDLGMVPLTTPLQPVAPSGSLIYQQTAGGTIGSATDTDSFTVTLDAGQRASITVDPAAGLCPTIQMFDPSGALIGSAAAGAAGTDAVLQTAPVSAAGTYTFTVGSAASTSGAYSVQLVLNAAIEAEAHNGPTNDSLATAQNIDGSFIALGSAARGAVVGTNAASGDDYYSFTLSAGQSATLAATSPSGAISLELYNSAGVLLAKSIGPYGNATAAISNFVAPAAGLYYVRAIAQLDYSLTVTRNSTFDLEPNEAASPQDIGPSGTAVGYIEKGVTGVEPDNYAAGTDLTNVVPGIKLSVSGSSTIVTSVTSSYVSTGTRGFGEGGSADWSDTTNLRADFTTPVSSVSLDLVPDDSDDPGFLKAYNSSGVLLQDLEVPAPPLPGYTTMTITRPTADIAYVIAGGQYGQVVFLDRLVVNGLSTGSDSYGLTAAAGDVLTISTTTPADGSGEFVNTLDPVLELYDPSGTKVATDNNSAGDGRNAVIHYTALAAGRYTVKVLSSGGTTGEYVLSASGQTPAVPPLTVKSSTPANGAHLGDAPTYVTLSFSEAVLLSTVDAADFLVDGVPATRATVTSGDSITFTLPTVSPGHHVWSVAAGALSSLEGGALTASTGSFDFDVTAPRVTAINVVDGATVPNGNLTLSVTFSKPMKVANLSTDDFSLVGAFLGSRSPSTYSYDASGTVLTLTYTSLSEDLYTFSLLSGDGRFEDTAGRDLDGEANWPALPSGNGVAGGNFTVSFQADLPATAYSGSFSSQLNGSMVYTGSTVSGFVTSPTDTDDFTISLDAGQSLSAVIHPTDGNLQPVVTILGPGGAVLATGSAIGTGLDAIAMAPVAVAGTYTIRVGSLYGSAGAYTVQPILNAQIEAESHYGPSNNLPAYAENIDPSFIDLGGAKRGAVYGAVMSGQPDWYKFTLGAMQSSTLAIYGSSTSLELYDSTGAVLLASGTAGSSVNQYIRNFLSTTGGVYYVKVTSTYTYSNPYTLVVTAGAVFDVGGNTSTSTAPDMPPSQKALGYADSSYDYYAIYANAGDSLVLSTTTPADGAGQFNNQLNPRVDLYNSAGTLIGGDDNSAPDGRNARYTYTAATAGKYFVRVYYTGSYYGEYVLSVTGATGALPPLTVSTSTPANNAALSAAPSQFSVTLSDQVLIASVNASDLLVDGAPAVRATVSGNTINFDLPALADGHHVVQIAAGAFADLQGTPVSAFTSSFDLDSAAPRVIASSITEGSVLAPSTGYTTCTITFSKPMKTANLDSTDFTLVGGLGGSRSVYSYGYDASGKVLTLTYSALPEDNYTLTLLSGDNRFEDSGGTDLDGEAHWPLPSGDGTAGGNFAVNFNVDAGTTAYQALTYEAPRGSLIYDRPAAVGTINSASDTDSYTVAVDAGQTLSFVMHPTTTSLISAISLYGPGGVLIASALAPAAGQDAVLQTAPAAAAGTYTVVFGSSAGTAGLYTQQIVLNAQVETEGHGPATNDTQATAEDLSASFIALSATADRAAVEGVLPTASSSVDWYKFTLSAGQSASIALARVGSYTPTVDLYDSAGNLLASSLAATSDVTKYISNFVAPSAGTYYAKVSGTGNYDMVVLRGAIFDISGNTTTATALDLSPSQTVLGYDNNYKYYAVYANAGDNLVITTTTPADGSGEFSNLLNPRVDLYNSVGTLIGGDDNSAPDGRNAKYSYTVPTAGKYYVRVYYSSSAGEYVLNVAGATGAMPAFAVTSTNPANGSNSPIVPTQFTVTLSDTALATSVDVGDLLVDGLPATSVAAAGNTLTFGLPALGNGHHTIAIAAGAFQDIQGTPVSAYSGGFDLDTTVPKVTASSVSEGATLAAGNQTFTITFSKPMLKTNLSSDDFTLAGQYTGAKTAATYVYDAAGGVLTLTYTGLPEDNYTLTLLSGDGKFEDPAGRDLDGEPHWPLPSGDGTAGGNFFVNFAVDAPVGSYSSFAPATPFGSLIYSSPAMTGIINSAGDVDSWTVTVDAGQTVAVTVHPTSAALRPVIELWAPGGIAPLATATAAAAGLDAVIQAAPATTAGTYTVKITGASGTSGSFTHQLTLNAQAEAEAYSGPANDTQATAEDLSASFISLGGADRGAVFGTLPATASQDWFKFTLAAGQTTSIAMSQLAGATVSLGLYDAAGNLLASGATGGTNVTSYVSNFKATAAGTYYIKLSGTGGYDLVVTRSASFEIEPNEAPAAPQPLGPDGVVFGSVSASAPSGAGTVVTGPRDVTGTPISLGFATDGSFVGSAIGAKWGSIEFLRYGTYVATYSVAFNGAYYNNGAAAGTTAFPVTMEQLTTTYSHAIRITGTPAAGVAFTRIVYWNEGDNFARVTQTVTNNTAAPLTRVMLLENHDPDPTGTYSTANDVVGRLVVATASGYSMGLGSNDPRAVASAEGFQLANPTDVLDSPLDPNGAAADIAINLAFDLGTLTPGASASATFALIFGAGQPAVESTFAAIGSSAGDVDDYSLAAVAGQAMHVWTQTPADGPNQFVNGADPKVEVYDPTGALVASDDNSGPDGRNADLIFTPAIGGSYTVRVKGSTGGEYVLHANAISATPGAPDLAAASDSGKSNADDITNRNSGLSFTVPGTVAGATVQLFADGALVGSAVAGGATTTVVTDAGVTLADGPHAITAVQTQPGLPASIRSAALTIRIDTQAPTASVPDLDAASDTGFSNTDNITKGISPRFVGPAADVAANGYSSGLWTVEVRSDDGLSSQAVTSSGYNIVMPTLGEGSRMLYAVATDIAGNSYSTATLSMTVDRTGPGVSALGLSSGLSGWALGVIDSALWTTGRSMQTASWSAINRFVLDFTEPVRVTGSPLTISGKAGGSIGLSLVSGASGSRLSWGTASSLDTDSFQIALAASGVEDSAGNALQGGDWSSSLNVLVGDINGDGVVNTLDKAAVALKYGTVLGGSGYSPFADLNGDGIVNILDKAMAAARFGQTLPN